MGFLEGRIVRFACMIGEGWEREVVDDGVDQQGVHNLLSSHQLLRRTGHSLERQCS